MYKFSKSDVKTMANALVENSINFNGRDYAPDYYYCNFCFGLSTNEYDKETVIHKENCPVFIAKNILTKL